MTKYLEKSAKTVDEAVELAIRELGLERDDVSVEILERPKSGFLGIGASPAVVKVAYEAPDEPAAKEIKKPVEAKKPVESKKPAEAKKPEARPEPSESVGDDVKAEASAFVSGLLQHMGIEAEVEVSDRENGGILLNLAGNGMGAVIGRRGETLDAIQHLANYVVNKGNEKRCHISVDAESYRAKREDNLEHLAVKMAEKALKYKRSMALEPMNSYERHVIHTALQNYEGVSTCSTGTEPNRRVVVSCDRGGKPDGRQFTDSRPPRQDQRGPRSRQDGRPRQDNRPPRTERPARSAPQQTEPAAPAAEPVSQQPVKKPESREWS